jgi:hypothetical protein
MERRMNGICGGENDDKDRQITHKMILDSFLYFYIYI